MPASALVDDGYDVYIVGGEPLDAAARLKVAGAIASRYRVAAPSVVEGLSGGRCLVGKRLDPPAARRLAEELGSLGAQTAAVPAGGPSPIGRPTTRLAPSRAARRPGVWDDLLSSPVKRAFAGLALALVIGFLPAAYYAFGISGAEVRRIRARQLELSAQPGTQAVVGEFDRLEEAISQVRQRGLVHTAIVWVLVSGIAVAGLSRLVPGGGDRDTPAG